MPLLPPSSPMGPAADPLNVPRATWACILSTSEEGHCTSTIVALSALLSPPKTLLHSLRANPLPMSSWRFHSAEERCFVSSTLENSLCIVSLETSIPSSSAVALAQKLPSSMWFSFCQGIDFRLACACSSGSWHPLPRPWST
eukprot:4590778-Amphidinium_carterae.2